MFTRKDTLINSPQPVVVYLHGFLSSSRSHKARSTAAYAAANHPECRLIIPDLDQSPRVAMSRVREQLASEDKSTLAFIGSSLGGFYATSLAEHYRAQAVLINPAVHPQERWHKYQGIHRHYHTGEPVAVTPEHTRELEALAPAGLARPQNYLVFLQRHDEVLDYRKAVAFYGDSQCVLRKDGDHSYAEFQRELPRAFSFLLSRMRLKAR